MTGDGFADYLVRAQSPAVFLIVHNFDVEILYQVVDESDGAVYGYYNQGQDEVAWYEKGKIAEGPPYYGGSPGEGVRFAGE